MLPFAQSAARAREAAAREGNSSGFAGDRAKQTEIDTGGPLGPVGKGGLAERRGVGMGGALQVWSACQPHAGQLTWNLRLIEGKDQVRDLPTRQVKIVRTKSAVKLGKTFRGWRTLYFIGPYCTPRFTPR